MNEQEAEEDPISAFAQVSSQDHYANDHALMQKTTVYVDDEAEADDQESMVEVPENGDDKIAEYTRTEDADSDDSDDFN